MPYKYRDPQRIHGTWLRNAKEHAEQIQADQRAAAEKDARRLILENYLAGVTVNITRLEQLAAGQP